ncbi:MAG: response regulator [Polyangiaceae bacterium]|jgi:CheY-like chemotaxis protein
MSKPKRILVIDDSAVMLERIKHVLGAQGYDVLATTQPVGNARHLPTCDLVLIDYHMPGLDGSSVVASLRSLAHSMKGACPLYVYTSDPKVASNCTQLGFDGAFNCKGDDRALVRQVAALFRTLAIRANRVAKAPGR